MKGNSKIRAKCPNCGEKTSLGESPRIGRFVSCRHCGVELEIISLDPIVLDWPYDMEYEDFNLKMDYRNSGKRRR